VRYLASRLAIVSSLLFLILWILSSLVGTYALAVGAYGLAAFLARPAWSVDLPLFGFLGLMIFGIAEHFIPLFAGRELERPSLATVQVVVAIVSVGIALGPPRLLIVGRLLWFGAAALFAGLLLETLRTGRIVPRPGVRREGLLAIDHRAALLTATATAYLLVASAGFALAATGGRPLTPGLAPYGASFLHLYTLGFVALSLFGVLLHLLPRFLEAVPSARWVTVLAALAIPAPAGVALTIPYVSADHPVRFLLVGFAAIEGWVAVLFVSLVIGLWQGSARRRPASLFFVLGGIWLVVGAGVGLYMASSMGATLRGTTTQSWLTVLGFAGFEIFGITHEVLLPYVGQGLRAWQVAALAHEGLATGGLLAVVASSILALAGYPRTSAVFAFVGFGLLLWMALSYAAGTFQTLAAISPPGEIARSGR